MGRRRSKNNFGSTAGKAVGQGCAHGCTQGCAKSLPRIILLFFFASESVFMLNISLHDFFIRLIRNYQTRISPKLNVSCLYHPSCSNYAIQAINKYGLLNGLFKVLLRICKCNSSMVGYQSEKITDFP